MVGVLCWLSHFPVTLAVRRQKPPAQISSRSPASYLENTRTHSIVYKMKSLASFLEFSEEEKYI